MFTSERIDLHLPTSWQQATVEELEIIARVMINEGGKVSSFHPFDLTSVKLALFFLLSDIEVCAPAVPETKVEDQFYLCRRTYRVDPWYRKWWRRMRGRDNEPFALYLSQISQIVREYLGWVEQPPMVMTFPYPVFRSKGVTFHAPAALMQDFSWQRYRFATDYYTAYVTAQNRLLALKRDLHTSELDLRKQTKFVESFRSMFLATLFVRKVKRMDDETHMVVNDFAYASNQSVDNAKYFHKFKDEQFQVVLFWWMGMMQYLQKTYPHCFQKSKMKQKAVNPLELYTRTTATMEKYLGLSEREVNRQLYSVVLQHLENMAKESEEMEKIKNKH